MDGGANGEVLERPDFSFIKCQWSFYSLHYRTRIVKVVDVIMKDSDATGEVI